MYNKYNLKKKCIFKSTTFIIFKKKPLHLILNIIKYKLHNNQRVNNFYFNVYKQHFFIYININIFFIFYIFLFFYILRGQTINFFWNHLLLSNFVLYLMFCTFLINFILLIITKQITYSNVNYSYDYFFSLVNLSIFLPLLFLSNNIFSFFFY